MPVDELELLQAPTRPGAGPTRGTQVVVVETGGVRSSSAATWRFGSASSTSRTGQLLVRALDPELVWLAHEHQPWRPRTV